MTKGNKQNGRQPPVSQVSASSTDSRCKNASTLSLDREKICRDFIWGICIKGARCAYRHERDLDHMKTVLKFCHDYQNKSGCLRPDCTYLHTTREEQNLFINKGRIPKVLADRYAAMAAASSPDSEVVNQLTFNGDSLPIQSDATITASGTAHQQPQVAFSQLLLQPPPPPPPATMVTTTVQVIPQNISTNTLPQVPKQTLNQHAPELPAIFDVSRPPPQSHKPITGPQKRPAQSIEAGPCKARKQEAPNVIETLCDNCVQRELRIEILHEDNQKLQTQKDYKALLIDKTNEEYEHAKLILKPLVKPEIYQIMEEYIEKLSSELAESETVLDMDSTPSPMVMSKSAKSLMKHFLDRMTTNGRHSNLLETKPITNGISEDPNLLSLTTSPRPKTDSVKNSAVELIQTLLLIYKGSIENTHDKNQMIDSGPLDKLASEPQPSTSGMSISVITELTHYLNGHNEQNMQAVTTNGISTPTGLVASPHSSSVEISSTPIIPFQPTVPPPAIRPTFPSPTLVSTTNTLNKSMPNPMVLPPPTSTIRPPLSVVHPPTFSVPPPNHTVLSNLSVQTHALPVRQPGTPTSLVHSPTSMVPSIPSKALPSTPIEQTPKPTLHPPVSTMQSHAITIPPPTLARQSTPGIVQGATVTQSRTHVIQSPKPTSPLTSQPLGSAKSLAPLNGKIFNSINGRLPPRPNFFPPYQ